MSNNSRINANKRAFYGEAAARYNSGSSAQTGVDTVQALLSTEINNRTLADTALQNQINGVAVGGGVGVPTQVSAGSIFSVPLNTQVLFSAPIELLGTASLDISGAMIEVN